MTAGTRNSKSSAKAATRGHEPKVLLLVVLVAVAVSAVAPRSFGTWLLEVAPIALGAAVLVLTYPKLRLTDLAYRFLTVAALLIALGAHYTYAEVPIGQWVKDWLDLNRNHYDRIGHVVQGAVAALLLRELLLRRSPLCRGWWLPVVVTLSALGISGGFELVEALAAALSGQAGDAYLGTQGDPMDAQWDMTCALTGAVLTQALFARTHDRQIRDLE